MFELPEVAPYRLGRPPLAQAVAQVRFPIQTRLATLAGVGPLQERLMERYPHLEPAQSPPAFQVQVRPDGVSGGRIPGAQQFVFSGDDGFAVYVTVDTVTLSAGGAAYQGASDFKERFKEILDVLGENARVTRCDRVAAKFLSMAQTPPVGQAGWSDYFRPEVIGWARREFLADKVTVNTTLSQTQLISEPSGSYSDFPGGVQAIIQTGLIPAGSGVGGIPPVPVELESYILDLDFFCEAPQPWVSDRIASQFEALHGQIDRFFHWSLTEKGKSDFEYEAG